ncbi:hypothetical protein PR202_gb03974 [Eleusine coracana subsp. coracana]|uniref:Protein NRT1/ PTR FAMILY 2.13-like n=1 Tax=Eleusine coracana subsp. coracana TaxID=191504 RepID=A0AAV5E472_ELECO|nr:hypothetical protein PR202_gb03974 [Eleusine coracana subsp. coracana]
MAAVGEGDQVRLAGRTKKPLDWKSIPFILANETFEKVASYGVAANLITYLIKRFYIGQLKATNITNIFFATLNFTPLIGAFISDSYLGRLYIHVPPERSIFSGIAQVLVASFKKRKLKLPCPHDINQQELVLYNPPTRGKRLFRLPITSQFRFLNKGAIVWDGDVNDDGSARNSWELSSIQQIEEVKCLIRIVPICFSGILCFVAMAQQFTFIVLQAFTMDCHLGPHFEIPAGTVTSISLIALTVFIAIYDRIIVPFARQFSGLEGGITLLQRQGVGLVISPLSMVVAGLVECKRRNSALSNGGISPMTVLWLAPQLVLMGIAEAFNTVGQIEFYNKQFPEHMQTLAGSLSFCTVAGANYLSIVLVNIIRKVTARHGHVSWLTDDINKGKLEYYYYFIAILGVFNFFYFLICSHYYQYKAMSPQAEESTEINIDTCI